MKPKQLPLDTQRSQFSFIYLSPGVDNTEQVN